MDGINQSKVTDRNSSNLKAFSGHSKAKNIHSYRSKEEFINRAKELANYARDHFQIKDFQAITNEVITSYINDKIELGLQYESISTYISQIRNIKIALNKIDNKLDSHKKQFTNVSLDNARLKARKEASRATQTNRAYSNINELSKYITPENEIAFNLQRYYGLRVSEATLIQQKGLIGNILVVVGKGGYIREISLNEKLYMLITKQLQEHGTYKVSYNSYNDNLKEAVLKNGQSWNGSHGMRYTYAQKQYSKKLESGMSKINSLKSVSYDLGHHRVEITARYLA